MLQDAAYVQGDRETIDKKFDECPSSAAEVRFRSQPCPSIASSRPHPPICPPPCGFASMPPWRAGRRVRTKRPAGFGRSPPCAPHSLCCAAHCLTQGSAYVINIGRLPVLRP